MRDRSRGSMTRAETCGVRVGVGSESVEVDAGWGSARVNSRSSRSRRTSGDSTSALHDGSATDGWDVKKVLFAACARAVAAAGVEDTAACAGRKELSDGVRFKSNVLELGPGVADELSVVEATSWASEEVAEGSCIEDRWSEVGIWTWAACSKKDVQN